MLLDPLAAALDKINRYDQLGKKEVIVKTTSNLIESVLATLQRIGYIGEFEKIDDAQGGTFKVQLLGRINKIGVIKPRFPVKVTEFDNFEKKYLPAIGFGNLIVSTPKGVITQRDAIDNHVGGRLLAFVY
jgi:small subunit ribosomal protein S8